MAYQGNLLSKTLVIGVIVLFLGVAIAPMSLGINIVYDKLEIKEAKSSVDDRSSKTVIIVDDEGDGNYTSIQDAIDNASDGDTINIPNGTYYENIVINKSISLVGENKDTTIIDGGGSWIVVYIYARWVNISGFTIQNGSTGIYLTLGESHNTITDNNITSNNGKGIYLFRSNNNNVTGNNISNNGKGIYILGSSDNTIIGNIIGSNNLNGIYLEHLNPDPLFYPSGSPCVKNTIKRNTISNNRGMGINLDGANINTILKNNFIDNEQDAYFENSFLNRWSQNYWNRPRILPKIIIGGIVIFNFPWFNIDWRPALKPYDI